MATDCKTETIDKNYDIDLSETAVTDSIKDSPVEE